MGKLQPNNLWNLEKGLRQITHCQAFTYFPPTYHQFFNDVLIFFIDLIIKYNQLLLIFMGEFIWLGKVSKFGVKSNVFSFEFIA